MYEKKKRPCRSVWQHITSVLFCFLAVAAVGRRNLLHHHRRSSDHFPPQKVKTSSQDRLITSSISPRPIYLPYRTVPTASSQVIQGIKVTTHDAPYTGSLLIQPSDGNDYHTQKPCKNTFDLRQVHNYRETHIDKTNRETREQENERRKIQRERSPLVCNTVDTYS